MHANSYLLGNSAQRELTMWQWLVSRVVPPQEPVDVPPVVPAPRVETTPPAERQRIDQRLTASRKRLEQLQAIAGLDAPTLRRQGGAHVVS